MGHLHRISYEFQDDQLIQVEATPQSKEDEHSNSLGLTTTGGNDYAAACRNQGVPIPPVWPDKWTRAGRIPPNRVFGFSGKASFTTLWTYDSPSGTCATLTRNKNEFAFSDVDLLGVICTSKNSGATCFWDNKDPTDIIYSAIVNRSGYDVTKNGIGATRMTENCTQCHRGATPWIRVAGTPTEKLPAPKGKWKPIGPDGWENAPGSTIAGCSECHTLPKLTPN